MTWGAYVSILLDKLRTEVYTIIDEVMKLRTIKHNEKPLEEHLQKHVIIINALQWDLAFNNWMEFLHQTNRLSIYLKQMKEDPWKKHIRIIYLTSVPWSNNLTKRYKHELFRNSHIIQIINHIAGEILSMT